MCVCVCLLRMPIYWNHSVPFSKPVLFQELGIDRLSDINTVETPHVELSAVLVLAICRLSRRRTTKNQTEQG